MATSHRLSVHPFNADSLPRLNDPTLLSGGRLFTWEEFLSRRAGYPSKNGQLFQHEQFLDKSFMEFLLPPGSIVTVYANKLHQSKPKLGKVISSFLDSAIVLYNYNEPANSFPETVSFDQINMQPFFRYAMDIPQGQIAMRSLMEKKLVEFIEVGQVFELQEAGAGELTVDAQSIFNVFVVEIQKVNNGLLKVKKLGTNETEFIHVTSERCHPLGWTNKQNTDAPSNGYVLQNLHRGPSTATPSFIFEFKQIKEHKFELFMLLEIIDPCSRMCFLPAYVSKILNSHFFLVRPIEDVSNYQALISRREIVCYRGYEEIYPVGYCANIGLKLTYPNGMNYLDDDIFSYVNLRSTMERLFSQESIMAVPTVISAPESLFEIPRYNNHYMEKNRFCEFKHPEDPSFFVPAAIVRQRKIFVFIHLEAEKRFTLPMIYPANSSILFPCGFAQKSGMRLLCNEDHSASKLRDITSSFTCQNISRFRENKKAFLSSMWLKDELWVPAFYINSNCFCGPFLCKEKIKLLPNRYGPTALPLIIKDLLTSLISCATRLQMVIELLSANKFCKYSTASKIPIKFKHANRSFRKSIEVCNRASEFPGWLRSLLASLDACPCLVSSVHQKERCALNCDQATSLPYMWPIGHVNFPSSQHLAKIQSEVPHIKKRLKRPMVATTHSDLESDQINLDQQDNKKHRDDLTEEDIQDHRMIDQMNNSPDDHVDEISLDDNSSARTEEDLISTRTNSISGADLGEDESISDNHSISTNSEQSSSSHSQQTHLEDSHSSTEICSRASSAHSHKLTHFEQNFMKPDLYHRISPSCYYKPLVLPQQGNFPSSNDLERPSTSFSTPPLTANFTNPFFNIPQVMLSHRNCPPINSNPNDWDCAELASWIRKAGYDEVAKTLFDEDVDGSSALLFDVSILRTLGIKLGPALKIAALFEKLKRVALSYK